MGTSWTGLNANQLSAEVVTPDQTDHPYWNGEPGDTPVLIIGNGPKGPLGGRDAVAIEGTLEEIAAFLYSQNGPIRAYQDAVCRVRESQPPAPKPQPDPVDGLTTLPHSGLKVPHTRLTVSGYEGHNTANGVAFAAKLRLDDRIVGTVENSGTGGATMFRPSGTKVFGWRDLEAFVKGCRDHDDYPVTEEIVLDALIEEHEGARRVAIAHRDRLVPVRLVAKTEIGDRSFWSATRVGSMQVIDDRRPADLVKSYVWRVLKSAELRKIHAPAANERWEVWTGEAWLDIDARETTDGNGLTWEPAGTDEPGDQRASSRLVPPGCTSAYYQAGPDQHGWSLTFITNGPGGIGELLLGIYADADTAKEAARLYENGETHKV